MSDAGGQKGGGRGRGRGRGRGGTRDREAAYRAFLLSQKEGLRGWASKRAAQLELLGLSESSQAQLEDLLHALQPEAPSAFRGHTVREPYQ
eukprot:6204873-Pleurochrysis_carterae.AAC.3